MQIGGRDINKFYIAFEFFYRYITAMVIDGSKPYRPPDRAANYP
jgi:hypothetical protein